MGKLLSYSCRMESWSSLVKSKMAAMVRSEMTNSASVGQKRFRGALEELLTVINWLVPTPKYAASKMFFDKNKSKH